VLSFLPLRNLFVLQRVSKQWGAVIAAAPGLREKMFLRPQNTIPKETWIREGRDKKATDVAEPRRFRRVDGSEEISHAIRRTSFAPVALNPVSHILRSEKPAVERVFTRRPEIVKIQLRPAALRKRSSLLSILISDPPCLVAEVGIVVHFEDRGRISVPMRTSVALHTRLSEMVRHHVTSNAGLTIGDCLTAALEVGDDELYHEHLKALFDGIVNSDGRMGGYRVRDVVLYVTLPKDGKIQPLVPTETERAAVARPRR
jgi:hypothetical protein